METLVQNLITKFIKNPTNEIFILSPNFKYYFSQLL